jgi:phage-related protein
MDHSGVEGLSGVPGGRTGANDHGLAYRSLGEKADKAKPMRGLGTGVFEIALAYRGHAYRTVYAVPLGEDVWVVHAFQKKSTQGIQTPKREIDLIRARLKRIQEMLP